MSASNGKRSRNQLRSFIASGSDVCNDDDPAADAADPRAAEFLSIGADDPTALAAIQEVFAGTDIPGDRDKVRRILRARDEIRKEWAGARNAFLAIGRALVALEYTLTKGEFARLRQGSERLFPFSDATATQFRQIARAVDSGRIPAAACPGSYGTAYQLTLLSDTQLDVARNRGLIRPDVTRREIQDLRREVATDGAAFPPSIRVDKARLRDERDRLGERRARLVEELAEVERRLAQLDAMLSPVINGEAEPLDG